MRGSTPTERIDGYSQCTKRMFRKESEEFKFEREAVHRGGHVRRDLHHPTSSDGMLLSGIVDIQVDDENRAPTTWDVSPNRRYQLETRKACCRVHNLDREREETSPTG